MAHTLSPVDRDPRTYTVTARDALGGEVTLTSVHIAFLPVRARPAADTVWQQTPVTAGSIEVVYAAPEATAQAGDVEVPAVGGNLYVKQVDGTYVKAVRVERISVS